MSINSINVPIIYLSWRIFSAASIAQLARAVEYTDYISAKG